MHLTHTHLNNAGYSVVHISVELLNRIIVASNLKLLKPYIVFGCNSGCGSILEML